MQVVEVKFNTDENRNIVCERFHEMLSEFKENPNREIVIELERGCYNATIDECEKSKIRRNWRDKAFVSRYSIYCEQVLSNLNKNSNYLANKILNGEIPAGDVWSMTAYEMCPQASQELHDNINTRKGQIIEKKFTDKITCRDCGKRQISYAEAQYLAGDESSTINYECLVCKKTWSKRGQ